MACSGAVGPSVQLGRSSPSATLAVARSFNHISRVTGDLEKSFRFYHEVLGFQPIKRPSAFEFEGAWLFGMGMGLHLIAGAAPPRCATINPASCHVSFQVAMATLAPPAAVRGAGRRCTVPAPPLTQPRQRLPTSPASP